MVTSIAWFFPAFIRDFQKSRESRLSITLDDEPEEEEVNTAKNACEDAEGDDGVAAFARSGHACYQEGEEERQHIDDQNAELRRTKTRDDCAACNELGEDGSHQDATREECGDQILIRHDEQRDERQDENDVD